jgi:putative SOS response-associated peptidase YedK
MCGRIEYIVTSRGKLEDHYGATLIEGYTEQGFNYPRYNIPPTSHTPVVTSEDAEEILIGHWGFIPSWAKERGGAKAVINARAETVLEKPYFKSAIEKRRCLIPITGFFEWHREGKTKTPYRFHMNGEIFSLAGLYTTIKDEDGFELPHYAIITTQANDLMAPVHDRMPVIVDTADEPTWVSDGLSDMEIGQFFRPYPSDLLRRDEISSLVNSVKNDGPDILIPVRN